MSAAALGKAHTNCQSKSDAEPHTDADAGPHLPVAAPTPAPTAPVTPVVAAPAVVVGSTKMRFNPASLIEKTSNAGCSISSVTVDSSVRADKLTVACEKSGGGE